jgi:hypothetical protein
VVKQTSKEKTWRRLSREKVRKCILQSPTNWHPHSLVRQIHYHFKLAIHLIVDYLIVLLATISVKKAVSYLNSDYPKNHRWARLMEANSHRAKYHQYGREQKFFYFHDHKGGLAGKEIDCRKVYSQENAIRPEDTELWKPILVPYTVPFWDRQSRLLRCLSLSHRSQEIFGWWAEKRCGCEAEVPFQSH